jgi:hypothetical protein
VWRARSSWRGAEPFSGTLPNSTARMQAEIYEIEIKRKGVSEQLTLR